LLASDPVKKFWKICKLEIYKFKFRSHVQRTGKNELQKLNFTLDGNGPPCSNYNYISDGGGTLLSLAEKKLRPKS